MGEFKFSDQELIDSFWAVKEICEKNQVEFNSESYAKHKPADAPTSFTLMLRLGDGTWKGLCRRFNVLPHNNKNMTELIEKFKDNLFKIGYIPTTKEYERLGISPSLHTIKNNIQYRKLLYLAGFGVPLQGKGRKRFYICPLCHTLFHKNSNHQKYCTTNCRDRAKHSKYREQRQEGKRCPQCGKGWIEPKETHRRKPKHCLHCQEYYRNRYKKRNPY